MWVGMIDDGCVHVDGMMDEWMGRDGGGNDYRWGHDGNASFRSNK